MSLGTGHYSLVDCIVFGVLTLLVQCEYIRTLALFCSISIFSGKAKLANSRDLANDFQIMDNEPTISIFIPKTYLCMLLSLYFMLDHTAYYTYFEFTCVRGLLIADVMM